MAAPAEQLDHYRQLATPAAADFLGVHPRTLEKFRLTGDGPRYVEVSKRCIRYRICDLIAWQEARLRRSTGDPGSQAA